MCSLSCPKFCVHERQLLWLRMLEVLCCRCSRLLKVLFLYLETCWAHGNVVTCLRRPIRCPFLMSQTNAHSRNGIIICMYCNICIYVLTLWLLLLFTSITVRLSFKKRTCTALEKIKYIKDSLPMAIPLMCITLEYVSGEQLPRVLAVGRCQRFWLIADLLSKASICDHRFCARMSYVHLSLYQSFTTSLLCSPMNRIRRCSFVMHGCTNWIMGAHAYICAHDCCILIRPLLKLHNLIRWWHCATYSIGGSCYKAMDHINADLALVLPAFGCCIPWTCILVPKMVLTLCNLHSWWSSPTAICAGGGFPWNISTFTIMYTN